MRPARWQAAIAVILILAFVMLTAPGRNVWQGFFSSLRIARPQPVTVTVPGFSGPAASHRLQDAIGGMVADTTSVTLDEKDQSVADVPSASRIAGFPVQLPRKRTDPPSLIVLGAHAVAMTVNLGQLQTIYREAGEVSAPLPASLNGTRLAIRTPRSVRAQYGNCPVPVANTIQGQIQGPPPPSTDNGDCIVLTQSPPAAADIPPGLDIERLVGIGVELAGMSPNQRQAFQKMFAWQSALSMSMPRSMRSYDSVTVNGVPGMLVNTGGRRGPTYDLFWTKNGIVFSLAGYGSSADAIPLATSMAETKVQP